MMAQVLRLHRKDDIMPSLMKGHTWRDHSHKMVYPCYTEAKFDEVRCEIKIDGKRVRYLSYAGKPLANMVRFDPFWLSVAARTGLNWFDTGFEVNGNFADTYRWVRSSRNFPADLVGAEVRFLLYDLPSVARPYSERRHMRVDVADIAFDVEPRMLEVPAVTVCTCPAEVGLAYERAINNGHEGLMVKAGDGMYEPGKRSYGWLKVKPECDADGVITALHEAICDKDQPAKGLFAGQGLKRIGSVTVRMEDGSVATPHGIPHELGMLMYQQPELYKGEWCEFRFMERDRQGGYRHPTFHRIREAKA